MCQLVAWGRGFYAAGGEWGRDTQDRRKQRKQAEGREGKGRGL